MPLAKQLVPIAFREGIDTKTAAVNSVPGRLLELENGVFGKIGEIRKRYGYNRLSSNIEGGTALTACDGLATFKGELLAFSSGRMYSYSEARAGWLDKGPAQASAVTETSVVRNTYAQSNPSSAISGGLTCVAWADTRGGIRHSIFDTETGTVLVDDVEVNGIASRVSVAAFNSQFVIFYVSANNLFYRIVSTSDPRTLGVEVNPISTLDPADMAYSLAVVGSRLYVGFGTTTAMCLSYFNTSMALTSVTTSLTAADTVAIFSDASSNVWMLTSTPTTIRLAVYSSAGAAVTAETTVTTASNIAYVDGVVPTGSTTAGILSFVQSGSAREFSVGTLSIGGVATATATIRSLSVPARPFAYDGRAFFPAVHDSTLQATHFVLDAAGKVVAKGSPGRSGGVRTTLPAASASTVSTGVYSFAVTEKSALESVGGTVFTRNGVALMQVDLVNARYRSAEIADNLVVASGAPLAYDGATLSEQGFHLFPEGSTASVGAGGGGLTNGEEYRWKVIYEWTDRAGRVHRSAPGAVTIAGAESYTSAAGSETVTLTIPTLRITGKSNVRLVVYRTLGNGSIYYRLTPIATPTVNSLTADSTTFADTYSDATIEGNELLYTDGSAGSPLDNIAPGPASGITTHQGRCFLVAGPNKIAFSQIVDEGEALAFNDSLYLIPDARGGDIVAIASMDDKLVILKETALYITSGDGPDDTGNGSFPTPILVTSDVGCSEARSVVLSAAGLMFKSSKGIYILDRSLQVTYIGAQVEDFNSLTITAATMVGDQNQVRFVTSGSVIIGTETLSGVSLVYDYAFNQWSVFTNCTGVGAVVWDGTYTRALSNGKVYTEDTTGYDDDGDFVKLKLTTSWLSFANVQGYQRVYRVLINGAYKSAHSLRVRLGYNFQPQFSYDATINAETVIAPGSWGSSATWGSDSYWGGNAPVEWFQVKPDPQKCSAIRVSIEDSQTSSYGEGYSISNLALLVGVKRGAQKLPATRTV